MTVERKKPLGQGLRPGGHALITHTHRERESCTAAAAPHTREHTTHLHLHCHSLFLPLAARPRPQCLHRPRHQLHRPMRPVGLDGLCVSTVICVRSTPVHLLDIQPLVRHAPHTSHPPTSIAAATAGGQEAPSPPYASRRFAAPSTRSAVSTNRGTRGRPVVSSCIASSVRGKKQTSRRM